MHRSLFFLLCGSRRYFASFKSLWSYEIVWKLQQILKQFFLDGLHHIVYFPIENCVAFKVLYRLPWQELLSCKLLAKLATGIQKKYTIDIHYWIIHCRQAPSYSSRSMFWICLLSGAVSYYCREFTHNGQCGKVSPLILTLFLEVHINLEYPGVCSLVGIGTPTPSTASECASPPLNPCGWGGRVVPIRTTGEKA